MGLLRALEDIGVDAHVRAGDTGPVLHVDGGSKSARFALVERKREPYPNELAGLAGLHAAAANVAVPLLVAPYVSEATAAHLVGAGWSWADQQGNYDLCARGLRLRQRLTSSPPPRTAGRFPGGSGSYAIIRALLRFGPGEAEEAGATSLAAQAGVTQPRASQVLRALGELGLIERVQRSMWMPVRDRLLDAFLDAYPGPGGTEQFLYSLDPLNELARRAAPDSGSGGHDVVVSADAGPDLIIAWRKPTVMILYAPSPLRPHDLGLVHAQGRADANVILRVPDDHSVFATPPMTATTPAGEVALADPAQMIWDLRNLGGSDRLEAAGRLRAWYLLH